MLFCKILEGLVRLIWHISFDRSHHSVDSGLFGALGQAGCCGVRRSRRRSRGHRYKLSGSQSGSANSKAMLTGRRTSSSMAMEYPTLGRNGGMEYPPNGRMSYPPGGSSSVVPAPQSYLRPEQVWQPYQEADEDESGYIMQSWHQQPPQLGPGYPAQQVQAGYPPAPGYQPVAAAPAPASSSTASGFSRVKGGRAHYDSPFAIRAPARPSPLSSQVHLPPGARPPETVAAGTAGSRHARTRSQTAVIEDAAGPVPLAPSVLPPPLIAVDDDDSPASSDPPRRLFWFGRGGGGSGDSQDDGSSGATGPAASGGKTSLWPFGKRRRGSEADADAGASTSGENSGGGFVVMRRGANAASGGGGVGGDGEENAAPTSSFSVIRQPRPGTGGGAAGDNAARRQSTVG